MKRKLGVIVDGPGDVASLRARYMGKFTILKTDGPRGHAVSAHQIASNARKEIMMLVALGCEEVLVMTDLESRPVKQSTFMADLQSEFQKANLGIPVCVAVPDIMIENWFLADIEFLSAKKKYLKDKLKQKHYEGKHGKDELRKLFQPGLTYKETKHGPELFKIIRVGVARKNSTSFNLFLEAAKKYV